MLRTFHIDNEEIYRLEDFFIKLRSAFQNIWKIKPSLWIAYIKIRYLKKVYKKKVEIKIAYDENIALLFKSPFNIKVCLDHELISYIEDKRLDIYVLIEGDDIETALKDYMGQVIYIYKTYCLDSEESGLSKDALILKKKLENNISQVIDEPGLINGLFET